MALTTQEIQSILSDELNILAKRFNTGTMNPQTVAAIKELQAFLKIPVTGISDDTTYKVLDQLWNKDRRTSLFHHFNPSAVKTDIKDKNKIFAIQDILIKYKIFSPKNRTGIYDQQTFEAVKILQKILKLKPTGIFDQELQSEINKNPGAIIDAVKPYNLSDPSGGGILWKSIQQKLDVNKLPSENSFLIYDGNYLCWVSNNRIVQKWRALSGSIPWRELEPKQTKKAPGGLPPGRYGIGQIQEMKYKMSDYSVFDLLKYDNRRLFYSEPETHSIIDFTTQQKNILTHIGWGNWRIPIIGKRFGRGSFYIHGGGIISSAGCIDIGDQGMENFSQVFAKTFGSKKHSLFLLVFYGSTAEEILNNNQLLSALKNATKDKDSEILISKGEEIINQAKTKQAAEAAAKTKQAAEAAGKAKKAAEQKKIEKKKREEDQRRAEEERKAEEEKNSFWGRIKGLAGLS